MHVRAEPLSAPDRYLMFGLQDRACVAQSQVVEVLVSALAGLLALPQLNWADAWWSRMKYDGPIVSELRLRFTDGR